MCDLKGHISVFRLCEFGHFLTDSNWDSSQTKTKAHCKERRLEFLPSACQTYAIGKQLIVSKSNNTTKSSSSSSSSSSSEQPGFRMLAACGRKLYLIEYVNPNNSMSSSSALSSSTTCLQQVCNTCNASLNSSSIVNCLVQNPIIGVTQLASGAPPPPPLVQQLPSSGSSSSTITSTVAAASSASVNNVTAPLSSSASGQNICAGVGVGGEMCGGLGADRNDLTKMFQIRKEFTCSDVPNLINLVTSFSGENYILVSYKNKFELLSERTGEVLKQFQFNPMSNIRSIVELYDNQKLEILVTYNCKLKKLNHFNSILKFKRFKRFKQSSF